MRFPRRLLSILIPLCVVIALLLWSRPWERKEEVIAVIPKTTATDFWESLHQGVIDGAKGSRFKILWNAPQSESDYAKQAQMVEQAIQDKVSGIILAPSHESVLASAVRHAYAEHIPIVIVDSPVAVTHDHLRSYIASDDNRIGELAALRMGSVVGNGEIGIIGASPTVEDSIARERAFSRAIAARFPAISIVDIQYGLSNSDRSRTLTLDLLRDHPDLKGVFTSDEFATRGAASALRQQPRNRPVILVGVAQERDMISQVQDGSIDALVVQDPYRMGYLAMRALVDPSVAELSHGGTNADIALLTRQNANSPEMRQLFSHYAQ
jgi:ribose transport system substrate-binding protein